MCHRSLSRLFPSPLLPLINYLLKALHSYFLEKHMLAHFLNILSQKTSQQVKVQLLQTLSILITGIKSETHLCTFQKR